MVVSEDDISLSKDQNSEVSSDQENRSSQLDLVTIIICCSSLATIIRAAAAFRKWMEKKKSKSDPGPSAKATVATEIESLSTIVPSSNDKSVIEIAGDMARMRSDSDEGRSDSGESYPDSVESGVSSNSITNLEVKVDSDSINSNLAKFKLPPSPGVMDPMLKFSPLMMFPPPPSIASSTSASSRTSTCSVTEKLDEFHAERNNSCETETARENFSTGRDSDPSARSSQHYITARCDALSPSAITFNLSNGYLNAKE